MSSLYCPMIRGGLNIDLKEQSGKLTYNQCCLSTSPLCRVGNNIEWNNDFFSSIREENKQNKWLPECWECERLEMAKIKSFRQSMIEKFGIKNELSGPQRIDLLFDRSCNLACRICGPKSSTFWEKHLKDNKIPVYKLSNTNNLDKIKNVLQNLDLSNLEMVQFCGGETLLGNTYWQTAEFLASIVSNPKLIEIGFQTNCTQPIDKKYYELIEKFKLVKFMLSIDGIGEKFDYLRWPANWNQTVDNLFHLRETLPSNVMFFVQETSSCLNLFYYNEVGNWVKENFNSNREGDITDHSTQLVKHSYLDVKNITKEYVDAIKRTPMIHCIGENWKENPSLIQKFISETEKFDSFRKQNWKKTFPEVASFYSRYF